MKKILRNIILAFICLLGVFNTNTLKAQPVLAYQQVTSGLTNPVDVVAAPVDGRLFIVQQNGIIRIWNGTALSDFINLNSVLTSPLGGEQGLLSIAFHPDYNTNRYFFVWYTNSTGAVTLARYRRNLTNPDIADLSSAQVLLTIAKPGSPYFTNHNGGKINFGADGFLYISTGDGGSGGDPFNNAQNGASLLGKMLRIDVNSFATSSPLYDIPPTNPFLAPGDGILDEIYATGLRNPWRWSFDRANGDMWIGDVGQGVWEEVNWLPAGSQSGVNFGWSCYEGANNYNGGCNPVLTDTVAPVFQYGHNGTTGGFSITGGYVYRGTEFPALQGYYISTDYVSTNLWLIRPNGVGGFTSIQQSGVLNNISSYGEGADGTLYAVRRSNGTLYKVIVTAVLPATLESFTGKPAAGFNQLRWNSLTEINTQSYFIEYSSNGVSFTRVGEVAATGIATGSSYEFKHSVVQGGTVYYRLAIADADGSVRYSEVITLNSGNGAAIKIWPNVISNGLLQVESSETIQQVELINSNGAVVFRQRNLNNTGRFNTNLPALSSGIYLVRFFVNNKTFQEKIVIQ